MKRKANERAARVAGGPGGRGGRRKREEAQPGPSASQDIWRYLSSTALGVPNKSLHGSFVRVLPSSSYIYEHLSLPLHELDIPRNSMRADTHREERMRPREGRREARASARGRFGEGEPGRWTEEAQRRKRPREREPEQAEGRKASVTSKLAAARMAAIGGGAGTSPRERLSPKATERKQIEAAASPPTQVESSDAAEDATSSALARARARALESANLAKSKGKGSKGKSKGNGGKGKVERRVVAGRVTLVTSPVAPEPGGAIAVTEEFPDSEADLRAQALRSMLLKGVAVRRKPLTKT